jgi:hypothetical protein
VVQIVFLMGKACSAVIPQRAVPQLEVSWPVFGKADSDLATIISLLLAIARMLTLGAIEFSSSGGEGQAASMQLLSSDNASHRICAQS